MKIKQIEQKLLELADLADQGWQATQNDHFAKIQALVVSLLHQIRREGNPDRTVAGEIER
jgi:hypothetical protein